MAKLSIERNSHPQISPITQIIREDLKSRDAKR